ncbi:MAG: GNAT family N-acetyltransferase [Planctomycetota bacterium]|jgi:GNAT superfamily N-acetyltransferase|nr:GNAT family N-acetyltransferase [Planctomycetota bacterium]
MEDVTILDERNDMTAELDAAIRESLCLAMPGDAAAFSVSRAWHGSAPSYSAILQRHGRAVAHAGVVDRTIVAGRIPVRVAGVQNVFVLPEERGRGLSTPVMRAAMLEAGRRGFDLGLLFCLPELAKIYAPLGWTDLGVRDVVRTAHGERLPLPGKNIAMFHALRLDSFPEGQIDLRGNDW